VATTYKRMNPLSILTPRRRKRSFILRLPPYAKLLDIGCGNNSPKLVKSIRADINYTGIDIGDYHQSDEAKSQADQYVLTTPELFDVAIAGLGERYFDAVISAHNIEHCLYPDRVLRAMCSVLRPSGILYMAFPSEASVNMPSRKGTLNFYDDPTHRVVPVWRDVLQGLAAGGMKVMFASRRYRPWAAFLLGLAWEPFVAPFKEQAPRSTTWALYGFESVIWAIKKDD
jgi:2-polyprenyl-3-methyl-5-hydroxy-6-metoxy-1,4-benzoquinol methylase